MQAGRQEKALNQQPSADGRTEAYAIAAMRIDRQPYVRKCAILAFVLLVLAVLSLPIGGNIKTLYSFSDVLNAFSLWFQTTADALLSGTHQTSAELLERCPGYFHILSRFAITFIAIACGAMTALSGALYQMVFRNPIAAPTMLGVGNGVTLGVVALVLLFGAAAPYMTGFRYAFCYVGALVVLAAVVGIALGIGKGHLVVVDMLLVGTIVSALAGQAVLFFTYCVFDEDAWTIYNALNEMLDVSTEPLSLIVLIATLVISAAPIALLRFKLNAVAFDEADMRLSGMNPTLLRFVALACATVMIISSQVQIGTISMVALIAPYVARSAFGAEFSKQFWGSALIGAILVLLCADVSSLAEIGLYAHGLSLDFPLGLAANIVCLPLFAWVIAAQSRIWE